MRSIRSFQLSIAAFAAVSAATAAAQTPFTYQGQLKHNGQPFNGTANVTFSLYDAATGTGFIGDEVHNGVPVSNGQFTVEVGGSNSWDNQFSGDIWLEVNVNGTTLSPRQKITAAPRAITAKDLVLPFDSTDNVYVNGAAAFRVANQGSGGALTAQSSNGNGSALVGHNSSPVGPASGVYGLSRSPQGYGGYFENSAGGIALRVLGPAQVQGDVRLGNASQYLAASGEENLRIMRGAVHASGAVTAGAGFTVQHSNVGEYRITFNTPFSGAPSCTHSGQYVTRDTFATFITSSSFVMYTFRDVDYGVEDMDFSFIVVGPR